MAAASSSSLRLPSVVEALSRSLPDAARLSPEQFRLAKFDRPEASVTFWKLLYTLLKQIQGGGQMESPDIEVSWIEGFWKLLPLLVALKVALLPTGAMRRSNPHQKVSSCDTLVKSLQFERNVDPAADVKGHRDIRYLQWLNGQLEFQWRNCHTEQQEQCKLLHEVHLYTSGSHVNAIIGHFSITEVDVVRQPDSYKQLLHFIESDNSRLEAFLKWKPMEPVYWHWMDTVLDSETKEAKAQDICNKDTVLLCADLCCSGLSRTIEELERCKSDLVTLREELHGLVMYKKRNSCRKVRAREQEQLGEKEFNRTIKRIEAAVDLKLSDLKCHNHVCTIKKIHGPYRLVFKGKCLKGHKMDSIKSAATNKAITKGITAEDVITDLRKQEAKLKAELKQQQEKSRNKLHEAVKKLNHMLFIPPMKRQKARDKDTIQFGKVC